MSFYIIIFPFSVNSLTVSREIFLFPHNAAKAVADGTFEGGVVRYTLADNGVGLPEENPNLTEEELAAVEEATQKIVSGEVVVSETAVNNDLTIGD